MLPSDFWECSMLRGVQRIGFGYGLVDRAVTTFLKGPVHPHFRVIAVVTRIMKGFVPLRGFGGLGKAT